VNDINILVWGVTLDRFDPVQMGVGLRKNEPMFRRNLFVILRRGCLVPLVCLVRRIRSVGESLGRSRALPIALTRHGWIAAEKIPVPDRARTATRRAVAMALGSTLIGGAVGLLVHAQLGLTPYDVLLSALRNHVGISMGQAAWGLSLVFFVIAALLGQRPRPTSALFVVLNGLCVDVAIGLIRTPDSLMVRVGFVALAVLFLAAGVSLVVHSGLTGGSFELLMQAGAARGIDPMRVRNVLEVGLFAAGTAFGGDFGVATVVYALVIGSVMRAMGQALDDHRRGRRERLLVVKNDLVPQVD